MTLGLVLLSLGAGDPGEVQTTVRFAVCGAVAALGAASIVGRAHWPAPSSARWPDSGTPARPSRSGASAPPVDGVVVVAALVVPAFGLVAFWLYSLGMHRAAVPSTTASMIVAQTFVPAAVGVALLGDGSSRRRGVVAGLVSRRAGRWCSAAPGRIGRP